MADIGMKFLFFLVGSVFFVSLGVAPDPRHPLSQIDPVDEDLEMEGYGVSNVSELSLDDTGGSGSGLVLDDFMVTHEGGLQRFVLDYQNDEWDIENSNLNLNGNNITNVNNVNIQSADGSVDLDNGDLNNVSSIDGGGDAVAFNDSINLDGNLLQNADWSGADDLNSVGGISDFSNAGDLNSAGSINDFSAADDLDGSGNVVSFDQANDLDGSGNIADWSGADDLNSVGGISDFSNAGDLNSAGSINDFSAADDLDGSGNVVSFDQANDLDGSGNINDFSAANDLDSSGNIADWSGADDLDGSGNVVSFDQANDLDGSGNINDFSAANDLDGSGNVFDTKCSGNDYLAGDGTCLVDSTGTDDQTLAEVLGQGNTANQNIDLNNNNINGINNVYGYGTNVNFQDRPQSQDGLYIDSGIAYFDSNVNTDTVTDRSGGNLNLQAAGDVVINNDGFRVPVGANAY